MAKPQGEDVVNRPLPQVSTDIWGDRFINFSTLDDSRLERYNEDIEPLKEEVRTMLIDHSIDVGKKMILIDAVERLGISYFYEHEIEAMLHQIFEEVAGYDFQIDCDLCQTAAQFRVFRQHGYNISCDTFNKFTNGEGKFKGTIESKLRDMVSLYEAAHLRVHGEHILEEALVFTTGFLNSIAKSSKQARQVLKHPLHHSMLRVGHRHFISAYEEDESRNKTLLRLAKMDFNRLQLLYRKELSQLQKWWNSFDFARRLPYLRNRSVESHFYAIGLYYEPQYSLGRILAAKVVLMIIVLDDTYDAYGTLEELLLLTNAFERWDLSAMDQLSDNMKIVYEFVINLCDDFDKEMAKKGKPYAAQYVKEIMRELIRYFMEEVKRREAKHIPSYEEYMVGGRITGTGPVMLISSLMGIDEITSVKPFELIRQSPKSIRACEVICRVTNDIYTHEDEQARGEAPSAVECYMNEYGVSMEEAIERLEKMVDDAWKDINEEILDNIGIHKGVIERVVNICRTMNVLYKNSDGVTHPAKVIKDHVTLLYARPLSI